MSYDLSRLQVAGFLSVADPDALSLTDAIEYRAAFSFAVDGPNVAGERALVLERTHSSALHAVSMQACNCICLSSTTMPEKLPEIDQRIKAAHQFEANKGYSVNVMLRGGQRKPAGYDARRRSMAFNYIAA